MTINSYRAGSNYNTGIYRMSPGIAALAFIPSKGPSPSPYLYFN